MMKRAVWSLVVGFLLVLTLSSCGAAPTSNEEKGPTIALTEGHGYAVKEDGSLWTWQYAGNHGANMPEPAKVMEGVQSVNAGFNTVFAIDKGNVLWGWGSNFWGQLGDGITDVATSTPLKIMEDVRQVSASGNHTLALKTDGSLWAWGRYDGGVFGDGRQGEGRSNSPEKILDGGVRFVEAGPGLSLIIKDDDSLWVSGSNDRIGLGDGTLETHDTFFKIMDDVEMASTGGWHVMVVKKDGSLWAWGENRSGSLGDGTTDARLSPVKIMDDVTSVSAGQLHSAAIKKDGSLWSWGANENGQLGSGSTAASPIPGQVMENVVCVETGYGFCTLALTADGRLWYSGYDGGLDDVTISDTVMQSIMDGVMIP
jgi:alpha-tubulin suppressor-like RCC1 family protein